MKKKDEINVKGISHKIQTYQVVDKNTNLMKNNIFLDEEYDGFTLKVDLNLSNKEKVVDTLEKALKKLIKKAKF